jgi:hypothetical protein
MVDALRVRGVCPKCRHVVDTTAPKGRATWRGSCPAQGCPGQIVARRVKDTAPPAKTDPPADTTPPAQPPGARRRRKVVKVDGYSRTVPEPPRRPADVQQPPGGSGAADGAGAGKPEPEPGPAKPARTGRTEVGTRPGHAAAAYGYEL